MSKRSYGQYCGLAHALDLVGERWTLLIIRELLTGPKRYKDLLKRLEGIGTNLLAKRLKDLEGHGLLTRSQLPPPASTTAYVLTDLGRGLEPAVLALVDWGYQTIGRPAEGEAYWPGWSVLAMKSVFRPDRALGLDVAYEYRIGEEVFHAYIRDGHLTTGQGPAQNPVFVMHADVDTFLGLVAGTLTAEAALAHGTLTLDGDPEAFTHSFEVFDLETLQSS